MEGTFNSHLVQPPKQTTQNKKQPHTCMKLNFTNDSLYQAQTNGIPSQKKISGWKKKKKQPQNKIKAVFF